MICPINSAGIFGRAGENPALTSEKSKIGALAEFPHKFEVVSDKLLSLWGIRFTIVMNYLAFYTVDDATQTVYIVRFLYGKSNWITILKTDAANGSLPVFS